MKIRISYRLDRATPLYPGTPPVRFEAFRSIESGDSSNSSIISLSSHAGTHIDLPRHFCGNGKSAADLLGEENTIGPVYCLDIPKKPGEFIQAADIRAFPVPTDARGILIRTGFFRYRQSDRDIYTRQHPWVDPDAARFLKDTFPGLVLFGLDTISISNPEKRSIGHEAHRAFLCEKPPVMLLEDLDLSAKNLPGQAWKLTIFPVLLDELDGVPVIAFLE